MQTNIDDHWCFKVGDNVLLKLTPLIWKKVTDKRYHKDLVQKFDGSFKIIKRVKNMTYRLKLPDKMKIHSTFHVSFLKPYHEDVEWQQAKRVPPIVRKEFDKKIERVLNHRTQGANQKNRCTDYLIQWEGGSDADATWEKGVEKRCDFVSIWRSDQGLFGDPPKFVRSSCAWHRARVQANMGQGLDHVVTKAWWHLLAKNARWHDSVCVMGVTRAQMGNNMCRGMRTDEMAQGCTRDRRSAHRWQQCAQMCAHKESSGVRWCTRVGRQQCEKACVNKRRDTRGVLPRHAPRLSKTKQVTASTNGTTHAWANDVPHN